MQSQRNPVLIAASQAPSGSDACMRLRCAPNSCWDTSIFQGMSLGEMELLNQQLRMYCDFHPYLHDCSTEGPSLEGYECSSASTAVSEDGDEDNATFVRKRSQSCGDEFETLSAPEQSNYTVWKSIDNHITLPSTATSILLSWPVDAAKLKTRDQQIISPIFEICRQASCKLMLKPTSMGEKKRQTTFLKSGGRGSIEFKLVESAGLPPQLGIRATVGKGAKAGMSPDIIKHDFREKAVCQLGDEWDFRLAIDRVDRGSSTFDVFVEVFMSC